MISEETIAAISTAPGAGAIAIVRLSGPTAWQIVENIFRAVTHPGGSDAAPLQPRTAAHGFIHNPADGAVVDEVVVIPYRGPNSYTGEDLIEIDCHGSAYVTHQILNLCLSLGARLARAGEFTQRAFLNGRMDLTQAEAVLDLVQAKTARQSRQALSALRGEVGGKIQELRSNLLELLSRVVAGIDFPEEVGDVPLDDLEEIVCRCHDQLDQLASTVRSGRFLREGVRLAIVGKPNAGKSSLLNQLLKFERAIVTDVPGTTRDSLEELIEVNGIPVILIDTAGIRDTQDHVEKIGIERTYKAVENADVAVLVADVTTSWSDDDRLIAKVLDGKPYFVIANKIDLKPDFKVEQLIEVIDGGSPDKAPGTTAIIGSSTRIDVLPLSAVTGQGIEKLNDALETWVFSDQQSRDAGASLNMRQGELCTRAVQALKLVQETLKNGMPQDCLATDLKTAVDSLSEICGQAVSEELITRVFATFCIGK